MPKASVQQVQSSLVLQPSTFVWNVSIFVLQSPDTEGSMTMSAQLSSMLALQFFRVSPEAEADLCTFEENIWQWNSLKQYKYFLSAF